MAEQQRRERRKNWTPDTQQRLAHYEAAWDEATSEPPPAPSARTAENAAAEAVVRPNAK